MSWALVDNHKNRGDDAFFFHKIKALLSKERNSVTSNLATRDIYSTICIVASSYCGLHKPSDTYNAGNSYRSDSPTQVVFHFLSHPLSAVLLYRATSWCTFFWNLVIQKIVKVGKCLSFDWRQPRQATQSCYPPLLFVSTDIPRLYHI